jgi:cytochrome P450
VVDVPFDPYDPAFVADPYPAYRRLRERAPVYRSVFGVWLVTRYAEALTVITDPRFGHPDYRARARRPGAGVVATVQGNVFIAMNPPEHTRIRRIVGEVFTPGLVAGLRGQIQSAADALLDSVQDAGRMDVVTDFALRLPVVVIAGVLGIDREEARRLQGWVRRSSGALGLVPTRADRRHSEETLGHIADYFRRLLERRRAAPGDDVVSSLVRAAARGGGLTDDELAATCMLLFVAGFETTVAFIGTAILTLLRTPGAWEALVAEPALMRTAVDELLRYESPFSLIGREALEDVALGGTRIPRGHTVFAVVSAVNRDPAQFPDPDRVDLGRRNNRHLAFGQGIHACPGQGLARLEGQIALETLTRRLPGLRLDARPHAWRPDFAVRGLDSLPVVW